MMKSHLSSSSHHLHHFLLTLFFIFFFTSSCFAQDDQSNLECYATHFNCGLALQFIGYPFWGNDRPRNCGLEQLHLTCHNDVYATINISGRVFRVLHINQRNESMTMVLDQLWDDFCPQVYDNITFDHTHFSYLPTYENLTFFYDCSAVTGIPDRDTFNCPPNPNYGPERRGFLSSSPFSADLNRHIEQCNRNMTVPVRRDGVEEFRDNASVALTDLLNWGFDVYYGFHIRCLACEASGGVCEFNSTSSAEVTCIRNRGARLNLRMIMVRIGFGAAALSAVILPCILSCCCIRRKFSARSLYFWKRDTNIDRNVEDFIRQHCSSNPKRYSYSEIKKITNSFKDELGRGGYGSVYKGMLPNGRLVAVKILNASKGNGEEFINEVASIGRTSHINVVTLLGFCYNGKKRALVFEYMSNGSLDKFINNRYRHLSGEMLYEISLGIARGLEYLHRGRNTRILHFDIKPHNILLNDDFCPKIADFGLAKRYHGKDSIVSMSETRGTIGYIAPEVFSRNFGRVSHKSDVYSYGMLLIEMVGGKNNCDAAGDVNNSSEIYFPNWIYKRLELNEELGVERIMLAEESEIARRMLIVGLWCIQTDPVHRPPMNKVIDMLLGSFEALQIPPKPFPSSPPRSLPLLYSSTSGGTSDQYYE